MEVDKCELLCFNCHLSEHRDYEFYHLNKTKIEEKILNYKEKQPKINREEVIYMYNNGYKQIDIAKHFNASKGTISDIIKKYKNSE